MKHKKMTVFLLVLLALGAVLRFVIPGHDFLGYGCWGIALLVFLFPRLPGWGRWVLALLLAACVAVFAVLEIPILRAAHTDENPEADYVVVLGAGIRGMEPTRSLLDRLEATLDYLNAYPEAVAIVSGSQGPDEPVPEADVMADWLTDHGIASERVLRETEADNTRENLENSFAMIAERGGDVTQGVAIVTSEYHLWRAEQMALALGAKPLRVAARTAYPDLLVNYFIREAFAAAYMRVAGTLY